MKESQERKVLGILYEHEPGDPQIETSVDSKAENIPVSRELMLIRERS
jgi:hypothetical protein